MHFHTSDQEKLNLGFGDYTCNWGVHICVLYETLEERDEIIFGFLHEGDVQKDLQLYCPVERTKDDFKLDYSKKYPESKYNPDDENFSPEKMDDGLSAFFEKSQKNGKRKIRATAEMVWALEAVPGVEQLMVHEPRLNYFIEHKPWISICMCNLTKFKGSTIMRVLQTHPYTISGGVITENSFYLEPDMWLTKNSSKYKGN